MRPLLSSLAFVTLGLSVFACAVHSGSDSTDNGSEQNFTSAAKELAGSWKIDDASANYSSTVAYDFRPDGTFFRDSSQVLNGIFLPGAPKPMKRESGHYTVDKAKGLLTLHIEQPSAALETLGYEYTPAKILNGVFIGDAGAGFGHATLKLTQQAPPMSKLAFPTIQYDFADSYCRTSADCDAERADGTWNPGPGAGATSSCDTASSTCNAGPTCIQNVICAINSHFDTTQCKCVLNIPPTCPPGALSDTSLQPGASGGPDARSNVACQPGYDLCQIDPNGSDNDVCSDPTDCFACTR